MRRSQCLEERIIGILKHAEAGKPIGELRVGAGSRTRPPTNGRLSTAVWRCRRFGG